MHNRFSMFLLFLYHSCRFPQGVQLHEPKTKLWVQLKIQASCFVQEQEWDRGGNAAVCESLAESQHWCFLRIVSVLRLFNPVLATLPSTSPFSEQLRGTVTGRVKPMIKLIDMHRAAGRVGPVFVCFCSVPKSDKQKVMCL